jgi:hypothetical protein
MIVLAIVPLVLVLWKLHCALLENSLLIAVPYV